MLQAVLDLIALQVPDAGKAADFPGEQAFAIGADGGTVGAGIGVHPGIQRLLVFASKSPANRSVVEGLRIYASIVAN